MQGTWSKGAAAAPATAHARPEVHWPAGAGSRARPASDPGTSVRGGTQPPQSRAGWTRHVLSGIDALPPPLAARVLAAVPVEHRRLVEESFAIRWLPFEVHMAVLQALRSTLGWRAYHKLCADQVWASLRHPALFAKPARAALRLYGGASPFTPFRAVPPSLRYVLRNAGQLRVLIAEGGHALTVCYEGLPPRFAKGDTWSLIWLATLEALAAYALEGSAFEARVALTRHDPARGYFEWHAQTLLCR
jgi:hypothetical protein